MTFDDVVSFHGHACPGLAIGFRVAEVALQELGEKAVDEELVEMVEFAEESPEPDDAALCEHVYVNPIPHQ